MDVHLVLMEFQAPAMEVWEAETGLEAVDHQDPSEVQALKALVSEEVVEEDLPVHMVFPVQVVLGSEEEALVVEVVQVHRLVPMELQLVGQAVSVAVDSHRDHMVHQMLVDWAVQESQGPHLVVQALELEASVETPVEVTQVVV